MELARGGMGRGRGRGNRTLASWWCAVEGKGRELFEEKRLRGVL